MSVSPEERAMVARLVPFRDLDPDRRDAALGALEPCEFAPLAEVVARGEPGDAYYIVVEGQVEVLGRAVGASSVVLARIGPGQGFGEQALLPGGGGHRTATVVAAESGARLLRIARPAFLEAVSSSSSTLDHLGRLGEEQLRQRMTVTLSALGLASGSDATDGVREQTFADGEVVFRIGDPGDAVYFVLGGRAVASTRAERVARFTEGQCFGEVAVLKSATRGATVVAEGELRVLRVEVARFLALYADVAELRDLVTTLSHVSVDAEIGLLTVHRGFWHGQPAVTTVRHVPDGRRILSTKVAGSDMFSMAVEGVDRASAARVVHVDPSTGGRREIAVADGRIVEILAEGAWERLGVVCHRLVRRGRVSHRELALFPQLGDLDAADAAGDGDGAGHLPLCACMRVDRAAALAAIGAGHDTVEAVCAATGAGSVCGSCATAIHELVGSTELLALRVDEVVVSAADIWRLRLTSTTPLPPVVPGQHVFIHGLVAEGWAQRAYSLVHADSFRWDILVKREADGLLSSWLCDPARRGGVVRASPPTGSFVLPDDLEVNVVFLAGGVGVTPAIAMARAQASVPRVRHLHVVVSATHADDFPERTALAEASAATPSVTVDLRITSSRGRLSRDDIRELAQRFPNAWFYLCGSERFHDAVIGHLDAIGCPMDRVLFEAFTYAGRRADPSQPSAATAVAPTPAPPAAAIAGAARSTWSADTGLDPSIPVIRDATAAVTADAVFTAIIGHLCAVEHGAGPVITVFGPGVRVWNHAILAHAWHLEGGPGDRSSAGTSEALARLGWRAQGTSGFEVLPLIVQAGHEPPVVKQLPDQVTGRRVLAHPGWPALAELGLAVFAAGPGRFTPVFDSGSRVGHAMWFTAHSVRHGVDRLVEREGHDLGGPIAAAVEARTPEELRERLAEALQRAVGGLVGPVGYATPPDARPGSQAWPLIGTAIAGLRTAQSPLHQVMACGVAHGDVFTARLPGSPAMTYVLGARGHAFMNGLPVASAGVGEVLQIVPVFGTFIRRSDASTEHLEKLAVGGRTFLKTRKLRPEQIDAMQPEIDADAARRIAGWKGTIDLAKLVVDAIQRVSIRCVAGPEVDETVAATFQPLLRHIAAAVDVPRLAAARTPLRFLLGEYWAARKLDRALRRWTASGGGPFVDEIRAHLVVDGGPISEVDVPWAVAYLLFNACAYAGTYGFWTLVDLLGSDALDRIRGGTEAEARGLVEAGFLETVRRHPVTVLARNLKQDVVYDDGRKRYTIPAGHFLGCAPGAFTRDPATYRDPDAYQPDRYARGEPSPDAFGGGPFGCVAQGYVRVLIPTMLTRVLRSFDFALLDPIPHRRARPALHYPRAGLRASVRSLSATGGRQVVQ